MHDFSIVADVAQAVTQPYVNTTAEEMHVDGEFAPNVINTVVRIRRHHPIAHDNMSLRDALAQYSRDLLRR